MKRLFHLLRALALSVFVMGLAVLGLLVCQQPLSHSLVLKAMR